MNRTGINQVCKGHLMNAAKALVEWMRNYLEDQWVIDGNETMYRIINDFSYTRHSLLAVLLKLLLKRAAKSTKPDEIKNFY